MSEYHLRLLENHNETIKLFVNYIHNIVKKGNRDNLPYTIEFVSALTNDKVIYPRLDTENEVLLIVLESMKDYKIKYDQGFFEMIGDICKTINTIDCEKDGTIFTNEKRYQQKIELDRYNKMLFLLSLDYESKSFGNCSEMMADIVNTHFNLSFFELTWICVSPNYKELMIKIKKYNPILYNIISHNENLFIDFNIERTNILNEERSHFGGNGKYYVLNFYIKTMLFQVVISTFLNNMSNLKYDYTTITKGIEFVDWYLEENIGRIINNNGNMTFLELELFKMELLSYMTPLCKDMIYKKREH